MASPKLRFKGFDGDWNKNTIGNFVLNYKGGASLTPADFVEYSDCEVIPKKAISSGGLLQLDKVLPTFCTLEFFNSNQNYIVDSEYLITTLRDLVPSGPSIGYIVKYESNKKYILAQGVYGFRIKNDLNRDFLIQFSNTSKFRLHMQSIMVGSTQVHIRNQDYFSTELYTPSLLEQTKIATFLSAVDEKISQLTQKHALLSQYKQGMMQKLFSQQLRFKADDGSEFREWEEKELKDIAEINPKSKKLPESFIYIDLESVEKGQLLLQKNIELQDAPSRAQRLLAKGDVLFQMVRPYQQNNYYFNLSGEYVASTGYAQIRTKLDSKFIYYALHEKTFLDEVMNRCTGTSYPAINSSDLSSIEILIPCLEEQTKIANFLSAIDQKIEVVAQQIEQAKTWKKGLLQQMFI